MVEMTAMKKADEMASQWVARLVGRLVALKVDVMVVL